MGLSHQHHRAWFRVLPRVLQTPSAGWESAAALSTSTMAPAPISAGLVIQNVHFSALLQPPGFTRPQADRINHIGRSCAQLAPG
jgi:hypothetical protein